MNNCNDDAVRNGVPPISDVLPVAVRTYGVPEGKKDGDWAFPSRGPSHWNLIFDTETTVDESQRLRIGAYQVREGDELSEVGIFFDPDALAPAERQVLEDYASSNNIKLITLQEFIESRFVPIVYHWQATVIGFNLPFDLSRIARHHGNARGKMRPGFSFSLAPAGTKGRQIRLKHLTRRASLMEASGAGRQSPRGQRKRKIAAPSRKPAFVDVSTIAAALFSRTFSLGELAKHLNTPHQKLGTDEHGQVLTAEYLDYAVRDVQVTWECFVELRRHYAGHGLDLTPIHRIFSEASIGKAYLRQIRICPWREVQPRVPPDLIGEIMATYYGGRTEVHERRVVRQVLYCDFTSMYPTVSTLMGLWRYVIAKGVKWRDATDEARRLLDTVTLADLQRPETWRNLAVIVEVKALGDVLPVRAKYGYAPSSASSGSGERHYTIGLNHVTADEPFWYTLADCIASKLLTGRAPEIRNAVAFEARGPQDGLEPVAIAGKGEFLVDPLKDDLFKRIIELRMQTTGPERNALKLIANASGYGIFVQLDIVERTEAIPVRCHPASGRAFLVDMDKVEAPGEFFHPLLGTLITGAARLMLALAERLVYDAGLTWAFCDTDSMAITKPDGMSGSEFITKAEAVRNWFQSLNPYGVAVELFKLEDANFSIVDGKATDKLEPLYCFAVSSKRYALFNIEGNGGPVIRKATAHGLGHLVAPYNDADAAANLPRPAIDLAAIGVNRWQHDLWHCIVRAALAGNPDRPDYSRLPNFHLPAVTRYAATTAHLLKWFASYNRNKPYAEQVRPFNFMLMFQADPLADWDGWREASGLEPGTDAPCVIAPFDKDLARAAARCFDRDTGPPVRADMLKTYARTVAQYHLRPEPKFLNADFTDTGTVQRRHVHVSEIVYIGKEANRWEEQSYLGLDPEAEIAYGPAPADREGELARISRAVAEHGLVAVAREAEISRQHLDMIVRGKAHPNAKTLGRVKRAVTALALADDAAAHETKALLARVAEMGIRACAVLTGINAGHLSRVVSGQRKPTKAMLVKLRKCVVGEG